MLKKIQIDQLVILGFALVFGCFTLATWLQRSTENKLVKEMEQVTNAFEIESDLQELKNILLEAEQSQLLYLLTGESENYLQTNGTSETKVNKIISEIESEVVDREQQKRLVEIKSLIELQLINIQASIEKFQKLERTNLSSEIAEKFLSANHTKTMDDLAIKMTEMVQAEKKIIDDRKTAVSSFQQLKNIAVFGVLVFIFFVGFIVSYLIVKLMKVRENTITEVVNIIANSSTQIAATVEEQERVSTNQASSVNQTTTTINELAASAKNTAEQIDLATQNATRVLNLAESSAQSASEVLNLAEGGTQKVTETLEGMSRLKEKVEAIAHQIIRLDQQTNEIGNITSIVSDLANQTNMLALNAAVEAVRAGEQGKGFGVIATQIRQLADQSKNSTEKINRLIFNIQEAITMTVTVTEEGKKTTDTSIKLSQETGEAFIKVAEAIKQVILKNQQDSVEAINEVVVNSQQIAHSSQQQAIATGQVLNSMNSINQGAAQTATGMRETKLGIEKLNEAAMNLKQEI